jgi:hypothetical protein
MKKRTVSVTIERHYSKQVTIEVEVDENLVGEELQEFLTDSAEIDNRLEEALHQRNLIDDDTIYEYSDPINNDGGHL